MIGGRIKGVLSVSKSNKNTNLFIYSTQSNIKQLGWALFVIVALVSLLLLYWVTRPITRLTDYVRSVRDQSSLALPTLPRGEIRDLGRAFEELREALEGRKYIEKYVTTLTHELKSPITAIRGALEILQEDVREDPKRLFLTNIEREVERIQGLVEKLLALSSLQNRHDVEVDEVTPLQELYSQIKDSLNLQLAAKDIIFRGDFSQLETVQGNSFWIREALLNLVQNAVDFSPAGGIVTLRAERSGQTQKLTVEDQGVGVPDWSAAKVFNQFFSLPRPDNGKRSSGLGLSIVAEVAKLHRGSARLESAGERGTRATIEIMSEPRVPTSSR
jgi:two-component system sensor histidine kinase CreC